MVCIHLEAAAQNYGAVVQTHHLAGRDCVLNREPYTESFWMAMAMVKYVARLVPMAIMLIVILSLFLGMVLKCSLGSSVQSPRRRCYFPFVKIGLMVIHMHIAHR